MNKFDFFFIPFIFVLMVFILMFGVWAERDINTQIFGISRFEAAKLKESCEKSLPRDEKCVPKLIYEVR